MNNITLNASNEMHRKIADCFRGCEVKVDCWGVLPRLELVGIEKNRNSRGIFGFVVDYSFESYTEEITIDLDTFQPCIYTAMKHGLRVGIEFEEDKAFSYDFRDLGDQAESLCDMIKYKIKSIKILDLEKMDGVKEKVGEE